MRCAQVTECFIVTVGFGKVECLQKAFKLMTNVGFRHSKLAGSQDSRNSSATDPFFTFSRTLLYVGVYSAAARLRLVQSVSSVQKGS